MIAQFVYMLGETLCPLPDRAPLDYTIIDSTYINSISGKGTFDKCIIMLYTLTRRQ